MLGTYFQFEILKDQKLDPLNQKWLQFSCMYFSDTYQSFLFCCKTGLNHLCNFEVVKISINIANYKVGQKLYILSTIKVLCPSAYFDPTNQLFSADATIFKNLNFECILGMKKDTLNDRFHLVNIYKGCYRSHDLL